VAVTKQPAEQRREPTEEMGGFDTAKVLIPYAV
jgi:hypothetical protein